MIRESLKCPACGSLLDLAKGFRKGFRCPACGQQLRVTVAYPRLVPTGSALLSCFLGLALGMRGLSLFLVMLFVWVPILVRGGGSREPSRTTEGGTVSV
jgi:uncharacterized C2H2 Zn-finger protein